MISELLIKNVAIIETLHINFRNGLSVIIGETGAGKSIIIDALSLIAGGRASADLIRTGAEEAVVEAMFQLDSCSYIHLFLQEAGIEFDDVLVIKRHLNRSGKNRIYINGSIVTLSLLSELGNKLVTIHGQHDSQALLRPERHLVFLDEFAGTQLLSEKFSSTYSEFKYLASELDDYDSKLSLALRRIDILEFQINEITSADIISGEDDVLKNELQLLSNVENLSRSAASAFEILYNSDQSLLSSLRHVSTTVAGMASLDETVESLNISLEECYLQLEDVSLQLRDYLAKMDADPVRLCQIEDRLDLLFRLKRKYAPTIEEILKLKDEMIAELEALKNNISAKSQIEQQLSALKSEIVTLGAALGAARRNAAQQLEQLLVLEVRELAMPNAVIQVAFEMLDEPRSSGFEKVEFMFSPNPGETPRPLAKVASGGELSRLMLAFRQILPDGGAPTLIFDEVDTGIGGSVANLVGYKLRKLATGQQIFCITHLPQVAAYGEQHLFVEKHIEDERTITTVRELAKDEVVDEIARMLAGQQLTEAAREHASELVSQASIVSHQHTS